MVGNGIGKAGENNALEGAHMSHFILISIVSLTLNYRYSDAPIIHSVYYKSYGYYY